MKVHYDYGATAVSRIHALTLTIGHGEWKEEIPVRVRENTVGAAKRFEWAGTVDPELLDALQMSSDELLLKLTQELKRQ
jgi:hypothetical protein